MNARKSKTVLFASITVGVSLLLCFVFLEYVVGYFIYPEAQVKVYAEFHPTLGWLYQPGTYLVKPENSFITHRIHINEFGLRNQDKPRKPVPSQTRIIVLGDSFTFAGWIPQEDIFTSQLEAKLNKKSESSYQIINAGVEGYGNAQQLLLMREMLKVNLRGDIYVLQVFSNDILDNLGLDYWSLSIDPHRPRYVIDSENKLKLEYLPQQDKQKKQQKTGNDKGVSFKIFKILSSAIESYVQSKPSLVKFAIDLGVPIEFPRVPGVISGWYNDKIIKNGVPLTKELIKQIKLEVDEQQSKLLVMFIPPPIMVYPDTYEPILRKTFPGNPQVNDFLADITRPQRAIQQICDELEVPFLDLYPVLLKNNGKALYFPRDGHLNKEGHSVVADALAEKLMSMQRH